MTAKCHLILDPDSGTSFVNSRPVPRPNPTVLQPSSSKQPAWR
jgi:hypothetical protein